MTAQMKFDPSRPFKCRNGSIAEIAKIYDPKGMEFPIVGRRKTGDSTWAIASWRTDGSFVIDPHSNGCDLVNTPATFTYWVSAWVRKNGTILTACEHTPESHEEGDGYRLLARRRIDLVEGDGIENSPTPTATPSPQGRDKNTLPKGPVNSENWTGQCSQRQNGPNPYSGADCAQTANSQPQSDAREAERRHILVLLAVADQMEIDGAVRMDSEVVRGVSAYLRRVGWRP